MRRGKGGGKRKGKGKGKGRGGRRFFKKKKGRSHMTEDESDAWGWQDQGWDEDWSWQEAEESYAAKGKGKKGKKGKGKGKWSKVDYAVQSTEFDIVEQGEVPTLMSLPQMRNLRFRFDLHPDKAYLSSPVLGIKNMTLKVVRSTHLILDLSDVCSYMWNVRFEKHKKVSFFTDHKHFEFGYNQKEEVFALDDEWVMNEPEMELIRLHKRERHQTFVPSSTPIPPEFLDLKRKTILEFKNGKKEVKEDDWKASVKTKQFHSPQAWKGRTILKILPGGIENRTSVKVRSTASGPKRRGKPDDKLLKAKKGEPEKSSGSSPVGEVPATRKSQKGPISKPAGGVPVRAVPQDGDEEEDPFKDLGLLPAEDPPPRSGSRVPEPGMEDAVEYEPSDLGDSGPALIFRMCPSQCLPEVKH